MQWGTVIGLEVHVQLTTRSKLFSGAATAFAAEPNRQAWAAVLAMLGIPPGLNAAAVRQAVMLGLALNADIHRPSVFERKTYSYPDLPAGHQPSQLSAPSLGAGLIDIPAAEGRPRSV